MEKFKQSVEGRLRRRRKGDEAGFTLIELMVVILIIAILMAIAIPTYLGARNRAEHRAAQTSDRNALTTAKTVYASQNAYQVPPSLTATYATFSAYLGHEEPAVKFVGGGGSVKAINQVSEAHGAQSVAFASYSPDGTCWYLLDIESSSSAAIAKAGVSGPGTYYGAGKGTSCTASTSAPTSKWVSSFANATP